MAAPPQSEPPEPEQASAEDDAPREAAGRPPRTSGIKRTRGAADDPTVHLALAAARCPDTQPEDEPTIETEPPSGMTEVDQAEPRSRLKGAAELLLRLSRRPGPRA